MSATKTELQAALVNVRREIIRQRCRKSLNAWATKALEDLGHRPARHHKVLLKALSQVATGEVDRLMVFMPPGYAKSLYTSILFPAWFFAQAPHMNVIGASYGSDLSEEFSGKMQGYIRKYGDVLGYRLATENVKRWTTTNGGFFQSAGVTGPITGRRSNLTIIDDPIKDMRDAESSVVRDAAWEWYRSVIFTRKKAGSKNRIILVQTRWNEDDLAGRLLAAQAEGGEQWVVIRLPAICDDIDDPLGRQIGEALWPEHEDLATLERVRVTVGEYVWGALYQQDPKPRGASFFDENDLLVDSGLLNAQQEPIFVPVPQPAKCDLVYGIIDTAIKAGQEHNATAVTWYAYDSTHPKHPLTIIDWDIVQIEGAKQADWLPTQLDHGEELARGVGAQLGFIGVFIEDKATGSVLIQQAKNDSAEKGLPLMVRPIDSVLTSMGKEERAIGAAPYVVAGLVKMSEYAWEKTKVHKGKSANHQRTQITDFRLGAKKKDGLDLLDTFCYGVALGCGAGDGLGKGI